MSTFYFIYKIKLIKKKSKPNTITSNIQAKNKWCKGKQIIIEWMNEYEWNVHIIYMFHMFIDIIITYY